MFANLASGPSTTNLFSNSGTNLFANNGNNNGSGGLFGNLGSSQPSTGGLFSNLASINTGSGLFNTSSLCCQN